MADLLIRDIAPNLKRDIEVRAKRDGRSLSEEAKHLLRAAIEQDAEAGRPATTRSAYEAFRKTWADCLLTDEEHAELEQIFEESRRESWRPVPDFE